MRAVVTIGLDLAKTTVHSVGLVATGRVHTHCHCSKCMLLKITAAMGPCRIGKEACCGAHHMGRKLPSQGHAVRLMPPEYAKPSSKRARNFRACPSERRTGLASALTHIS